MHMVVYVYPWVITHGCVMPPRRGCRGLTPTVVLCHRDAVHMAVSRFRGLTPTAVLCHRDAVLCYVTATRFIWWFRVSVGFATPSAFAPPTAVLCHRYTVLYYDTATRFCVMSPLHGSVLCHRYTVLYYDTATRFIYRCAVLRQKIQ